MDFWKIDKRYGKENLITIKKEDRILTVAKENNKIIFTEQCDDYYSQEFTKEDSLKLIKELENWITND